MDSIIREYKVEDLTEMIKIWNQVVEEGVAYPQIEGLTMEKAEEFFARQTYTAVAKYDGKVVGLYILHPNNIGRCGHIANASYAVKDTVRGKKIGEKLVLDSLNKAKEFGFQIMQFNAVVKTNVTARHLYKKLGFVELGTIPKGFLKRDGTYEDIIIFYHTLAMQY